MPSGICYIHDLTRAVLKTMGMGAALDPTDKEATVEMTDPTIQFNENGRLLKTPVVDG